MVKLLFFSLRKVGCRSTIYGINFNVLVQKSWRFQVRVARENPQFTHRLASTNGWWIGAFCNHLEESTSKILSNSIQDFSQLCHKAKSSQFFSIFLPVESKQLQRFVSSLISEIYTNSVWTHFPQSILLKLHLPIWFLFHIDCLFHLKIQEYHSRSNVPSSSKILIESNSTQFSSILHPTSFQFCLNFEHFVYLISTCYRIRSRSTRFFPVPFPSSPNSTTTRISPSLSIYTLRVVLISKLSIHTQPLEWF